MLVQASVRMARLSATESERFPRHMQGRGSHTGQLLRVFITGPLVVFLHKRPISGPCERRSQMKASNFTRVPRL